MPTSQNLTVAPPLFLFIPANADFVDGTIHRLPTDWHLIRAISFFLLIGAILAWIALPPVILMINLSQRGQEIQATVSGTEASLGYRSNRYYVDFTYDVDGQTYATQQSIGFSTYYALTNGGTILVRYFPDDPGHARLWGLYASENNSPLNFLLLLGCLTIFTSTVGWILCRVRQMQQLVAKGHLIDGLILEATLNRAFRLEIQYGFTSPISNQRLIRSELRADLKFIGAPPRGTAVKVLYLNDKHYRVM